MTVAELKDRPAYQCASKGLDVQEREKTPLECASRLIGRLCSHAKTPLVEQVEDGQNSWTRN